MISLLFFSVLGLASVYALTTERRALGLLLMIGFTQDMVRKLTPGEPVIFIVMVGLLFGFILLGIWFRKGLYFSLEPFLRWTTSIKMPLFLFLAILGLQFVHSFIRYGNILVGLIGLVTYIAPFMAVLVGYYTVNSIEDIRRFMFLYMGAGVLVALTVFASFSGYNWTIFNEIGAGLKIYDQGTVLKSYAGMMRTGEIAAWHISTAACLIFTLTFSSFKKKSLLLALGIVALLMLAVVLTGRRKMLMMTTMYVVFYFFSYFYFRKSLDSKYFFSLFYSSVALWFAYEASGLGEYSESLNNYIARGSSVFTDATGRFMELGINPIQWAYNRVGLLGGGLGIASQGSYLFNVSNIAGGSGEGGLGKIMVELGLPGLLCIIWLVYALARYVNDALKLSSQPLATQQLLPLMVSLAAMLGANVITFSVATQIYSDIFILILLGLFGGFLLATPKIIANASSKQQLELLIRQRAIALSTAEKASAL